MAHFALLPLLHIGDHRLWMTEGDLIYRSDLITSPVVVPSGFETDLASIPIWIPEWVIQRNGRHRAASIVHDYLVRIWPLSERALADRIFLEAMSISGVPRWRRYAMYAAVSFQTARKKTREKLM